jgi:Xaa-Pro aminopeptidase
MINLQRLEEAQERMRENKIDAYMVLTHDDFAYFFGTDRYQPRAIIPAEGRPILVAFRGEEAEVNKEMGIDRVKVFASVGQQMKDVVTALQELRGERSGLTIGFQMGFGTPAFLLEMFKKMNTYATVVDIAPVMEGMRLLKDETEIKSIRRAAEIAVIGMRAAEKALKPGVAENDVCAEAEYAMRKAGGSGTATPIFVNSGVRSGWLHGTATDKVIEPGDLVVIDLVPRYKGYCANICRTFVAGGELSKEQQQLIDTYTDAKMEAVKLLRPGNRMKDVDAAAKAAFTRHNLGESFINGFGHGIGLGFEEKPMPTIVPTDAMVEIQAGMVLTAGHSVLSVPGIGGVRFEDVYVIGKDGNEWLTQYP